MEDMSRRFNGHISRLMWVIGTTLSQFWILERGMVEVVVPTRVIGHVKLQSNRHHQQTNTQLFTGRMPFLTPNQQCQALRGSRHMAGVNITNH